MFLDKWLGNVPIARKLYVTVGIMALLIAIELCTLYFAISTLSSVRALVGAEGLWSKAQKDAAYFLQKYGNSHNEGDYDAYLGYLTVPLGDHKTRLELLKEHPDFNIARQGFLEGRIHPDDIDGAINLFRRFHNVFYIKKAIMIWSAGDTLIQQQIDIGQKLHAAISSAAPSRDSIRAILSSLDPLNDKLTRLEDNFSFTLGEGSRWLTDLVLKLLLGLVLTVEICGLSITILVSRGIAKGLNNIIVSADKIAKGDFNIRADVYSRDEIGVLAKSFNEMTDKLEDNISALKVTEVELRISKSVTERLLSVKEKFLANMSHEIRTPMNAVLGFTQLLDETDLNDEQRGFVHAIMVSGQNLMTIINDILDYSKIESGIITLESIPFSVANVMESVKIILQQRVKEKKLELIFKIDDRLPPTLLGDPTRLSQIILNLADNAIKFTEKGTIEITVIVNSETDDAVALAFSVKDSGEGIPIDQQHLIFERFTQASADTTRKYGGTGLGLSIVKNLVELQKGTISVRSEPGKGSVFTFFITYNKAKGEDKQLQMHPVQQRKTGNKQTKHILIVEDNKINQVIATRVINKFGFSSDIAENGLIAIEKLKQQHYDLVLMDMQMPEMDGYEATTVIRTQLKSNVPIIALTAHAMKEEREKCLRLGMNEYISKPFDQHELYDLILGVLGRSGE